MSVAEPLQIHYLQYYLQHRHKVKHFVFYTTGVGKSVTWDWQISFNVRLLVVLFIIAQWRSLFKNKKKNRTLLLVYFCKTKVFCFDRYV